MFLGLPLVCWLAIGAPETSINYGSGFGNTGLKYHMTDTSIQICTMKFNTGTQGTNVPYSGTNTTESSVATSVADPDPGSGAFLTPG